MVVVSDARARWLARHILPHESPLRAWLQNRRLAGLEIDDIVQETYSRLIGLDSVDGIRDPKTYAFQTAYSVLLQHIRRSKIVDFQTVSDIDQLGMAAEDPSPEVQIADRDELRHLAEAIAALPKRLREVVTLRRIHGLTQREVALKLALSESTVEKHMSRGIYRLSSLFDRGGTSSREASKIRQGKRRSHAQADREGD
jgi:RNA polymerase sigma factor (sigma-70 family)